jgi:hypothetical protein
VIDQLERYGHWVEQRGDVQLSPHGPVAPSGPDRPGRRRSGAPALIGALALVLVAGAAVMFVGGSGADSPESVVAADAADAPGGAEGVSGQPGTLAVQVDDTTPAPADADPAPPGSDAAAATDQTPVDDSAVGDDGSATTVPATTEVPATTSTTEPTTTTEPGVTGDGDEPPTADRQLPAGRARLLSPTSGDTISLLFSTVLQASAVDGATGYRFIGTQDGAVVFDETVSQPMLVIPSPLNGEGPRLSQGMLSITVMAMVDDVELSPGHTMQFLVLNGTRPTWGS